MFTTGSKLYFGTAVLAIAGAIVYGVGAGWEFTGVMLLATLAVAASFLGGAVVATRDVAVPADAAEELAGDTATLVAPNSPWPLLGGLTAALTAVGAALDKRVFYVGLALLAGVVVEWVIQGWADRASADRGYNRHVRGRVLHGIEFPVLGALTAAFVVFLFSRVMLAVSESAAIVAFVVIGALVLAVAVLLGRSRNVSRGVLAATLAVGVAALLAGGIAGLASGEQHHEAESEKTSNAVSDKSNPAAVVRFGGGAIEVKQPGTPQDTPQIVLTKSNNSGLLFRQESEGKHRLVIEAVAPVKQDDGSSVDKPVTFETEFLGEGKTAFISVRIVRSGTYSFKVESEEGGEAVSGKLVVA